MQTLKMLVLFGLLGIFSCVDKPEASGEKLALQSDGAGDKLQWMTLEDVAAGLKKEKRPVLIDVYTTWCSWCKVMDRKTYGKKEVKEYVQQHFYPVKFDAEGRKAITWNGRSFDFNAGYKAHDFAIYLTRGELSFPTTVVIPVDGEPQAIPGYLAPNEFELIAKYFGDGQYGKVSFDDYQKRFKASW